MKKVVIFGAGDFAQVAFLYLSKDSRYQVVAFTIHQELIKERKFRGLDVIPFEKIEEIYPPGQFAIFVAIAYKKLNRAREEIYHLCKQKGYELVTYVNSKALVSDEVEIGDNCFIFENNVIQPFVKIGNDVIIWSGNHIGHHSVIGEHCFIASHAVISGRVKIGPRCFIGVNATLRDGIVVAADCVIGAGALVLKDTKEGGVYVERETKAASLRGSELKTFK